MPVLVLSDWFLLKLNFLVSFIGMFLSVWCYGLVCQKINPCSKCGLLYLNKNVQAPSNMYIYLKKQNKKVGVENVVVSAETLTVPTNFNFPSYFNPKLDVQIAAVIAVETVSSCGNIPASFLHSKGVS